MAFCVLQWCHPMLASSSRTSCCTRMITLYGTQKWIQARAQRRRHQKSKTGVIVLLGGFFLQNFREYQILWRMYSVVFLAFALRLSIQTSLSVAPTHSVFWRATQFQKTSTPQGYQWPTKRTCVHPKILYKKTIRDILKKNSNIHWAYSHYFHCWTRIRILTQIPVLCRCYVKGI